MMLREGRLLCVGAWGLPVSVTADALEGLDGKGEGLAKFLGTNSERCGGREFLSKSERVGGRWI